MRDQGLDLAIAAVGGVSELARRLGISQPSVSNWTRVPAERVLQVESATGVKRSTLRPDLYSDASPQGDVDISDVDAARAREYSLLAALLARAPDDELLQRLATMKGDATPIGVAHAALAEAASTTAAKQAEQEYFNLFIGIGRGELLPYGSYYMTGYLHGRPLARLRKDLDSLGIERAEGHAEPEDSAAVLCEIMAGLIDGRFSVPTGHDRDVFEKHVGPWLGRFFSDLEQAEAANFYRRVGAVGRTFMEIEREAFALPA